MFNMTMDVIKTHIFNFEQMDVTDGGDIDISELRLNQIVWALCLREGRLFYKNDPDFTWIYNLYDNYNHLPIFNGQSSFFIKRLLLDYFDYHKAETKLHYISHLHFIEVFQKYFNYLQEDIETSLSDLTENDLLCTFKEREEKKYRLSFKGDYIRKFLPELYIYIELISEDTPVPEKAAKYFELFDYDPFEKTKYFKQKISKVRMFVKLLEQYEKEEFRKRDNTFQFCKKRYFPHMKERLKLQESMLASFFGQDFIKWVSSCPVRWESEYSF